MDQREKSYLELLTKRFDESNYINFIKDLLNLSQFDISNTLEERKALLQMARPMFTVITYKNMDNNALGTNYYSKNTEPVKRGNNYDK